MNSSEEELLSNLNQMILETPTSDQRDTLCDAVIYIHSQKMEIKSQECQIKAMWDRLTRRRY